MSSPKEMTACMLVRFIYDCSNLLERLVRLQNDESQAQLRKELLREGFEVIIMPPRVMSVSLTKYESSFCCQLFYFP